jgi:hypothetical protein
MAFKIGTVTIFKEPEEGILKENNETIPDRCEPKIRVIK